MSKKHRTQTELQRPIPDQILADAINASFGILKVGIDKWESEQLTVVRRMCGDAYSTVSLDYIKTRSITMRKNPARFGIVTKLGGAKRKKYEEPRNGYLNYLQQPHWQQFRRKMLELWDYKCSICRSDKDVEVYPVNLVPYMERPSDALCLCSKCHKKNHGQMVNGNEFNWTDTIYGY